MDIETFYSLVFMIFGLGFFLFVILIVNRDHREANERRVMERREFGVEPSNEKTLPGRHQRK